MLRVISRALAVSALFLGMGAPARADHHMNSSGFTWSRAYTLTPLEYKRLRAIGLTEKEVFLTAQTAHLSGRQHPDEVVMAIQRGESAQMIANRWGLPLSDITDMRPEWKTESWKQAVERGDPWFVPSRGAMSTAAADTRMRDRR